MRQIGPNFMPVLNVQGLEIRAPHPRGAETKDWRKAPRISFGCQLAKVQGRGQCRLSPGRKERASEF